MNLCTPLLWGAVVAAALGAGISARAEWKPAPAPLMTRWAKDVNPDAVLPEYPRPQMVRPQWQNLNGLWDYAITPRASEKPAAFDGQILVPFAVESALSGVGKRVGAKNHLWYRRSITPAVKAGQRLLLHFGAVDWHATVFVNGKQVGEHKGGYDPFSFDITDALTGSGPQELVVRVWDPTNDGPQPRGKQVNNPGSIWYTPVSGIWQTVWLETVPAAHIAGLKIVPDVDASCAWVTVTAAKGAEGAAVKLTAKDGGKTVATAEGKAGEKLQLKIANPKLWAPGAPFLYDLSVEMGADHVASYFGLRKIEVRKDEAGLNRLFLNNASLFQIGPLDQGWWPDGLYTAPTDEALKFDIEMTLKMGFNMARKHVKVEPARWYYWCDKLGLLVWQDMPSGDKYIGGADPDIERTPESAAIFETELKAMIDGFHNHPCIVMWVPYNEGWGQWDTARITDLVRQWDPTRLVNSASGWTDRGTGDVHDIHNYPGPAMPAVEPKRAVVLGEFGGIGVAIENHLWKQGGNWGYGGAKPLDQLDSLYSSLIQRLRPLIQRGLAAAVYTQTTDVEIEVNGLMTYDRTVIKLAPERLAELHRSLHEPPPELKTVVPTSTEAAVRWRYTTEQPGDGWMKPDFDDSAWKEGPGGFGAGVSGVKVGTPWNTPAIWIRRVFEFDGRALNEPQLVLFHDEGATVYLNGERVAQTSDYTSEYVPVPLRKADALRKGRNVMAIECSQTRGGQYIDAGIAETVRKP